MIDPQFSKPLVSVLTPTFNANKRDYLKRCIESVLDQPYDRIEHVIADGGSTDGTVEIIKNYQQRYPGRITLVEKRDNGVGSGLKNAFAASRGSVLGWLDADDFYQKDAVSKAVGHLSIDGTYFIFGEVDIVNEEHKKIGSFVIREWEKREALNIQHYLVFCGVFYRREVVEKCGYVNDLGNDLYFYLNVAKKYDLMKVNDHFACWRLHNEGISLGESGRDDRIRVQRSKEDFWLVVRNGGSVFSPRALTYLAVLEPIIFSKLKTILRPVLPILRRISYGVKKSIAMPNKNERFGFAGSMAKNVVRSILTGR